MYVPNAFYDANHTHFLGFGEAFDVQLRPSTSIREFESAARRGLGNYAYFGPPRFAERRASLDTPVDLETAGLLALGIATAVAGAIVVVLLLGAEERAHENDADLLRALGATRRQLGTAALLRTVPFVGSGALLAVAVAVALVGAVSDRRRPPPGARSRPRRERRCPGGRVRRGRGPHERDRVRLRSARRAATARRRPTKARGGIGTCARAQRRARPTSSSGTHFAFGDEGARRSVDPAGDRGRRDRTRGRRRARRVPRRYRPPLRRTVRTRLAVGRGDRQRQLHDDESARVGDRARPAGRSRHARRGTARRPSEAGRPRCSRTTPPAQRRPRCSAAACPTHADEIAPGAKLLHELHAHLGDRVKLSRRRQRVRARRRAAIPSTASSRLSASRCHR